MSLRVDVSLRPKSAFYKSTSPLFFGFTDVAYRTHFLPAFVVIVNVTFHYLRFRILLDVDVQQEGEGGGWRIENVLFFLIFAGMRHPAAFWLISTGYGGSFLGCRSYNRSIILHLATWPCHLELRDHQKVQQHILEDHHFTTMTWKMCMGHLEWACELCSVQFWFICPTGTYVIRPVVEMENVSDCILSRPIPGAKGFLCG